MELRWGNYNFLSIYFICKLCVSFLKTHFFVFFGTYVIGSAHCPKLLNVNSLGGWESRFSFKDGGLVCLWCCPRVFVALHPSQIAPQDLGTSSFGTFEGLKAVPETKPMRIYIASDSGLKATCSLFKTCIKLELPQNKSNVPVRASSTWCSA